MFLKTVIKLIPLCQNQLKEHFLTWNPYMVCLTTFIWWLIYANTSYKLIRFLVPKQIFSSLAIKVQSNKDIEIQCRANLVAFLHSLFVIIYAFTLYFYLNKETVDPIHGKVFPFSILCWIICGYFVWDALICTRYLKMYGIVFLLHAILSVIGMYLQVSSNKYIFLYHLLLFMGTEVSTPFLHLRWFTLISKQKSTAYFKIVNMLFLISFAAYRFYFIHLHVIIPYVVYISNTYSSIPLVPRIRCFCLIGCLGLWSCLNIYWAYLLILSQHECIDKTCPSSDAQAACTENAKSLIDIKPYNNGFRRRFSYPFFILKTEEYFKNSLRKMVLPRRLLAKTQLFDKNIHKRGIQSTKKSHINRTTQIAMYLILVALITSGVSKIFNVF